MFYFKFAWSVHATLVAGFLSLKMKIIPKYFSVGIKTKKISECFWNKCYQKIR